ncbi:MAG: membrane dipeptidase [Acidobacteria bacterium]|nr:membrane dipeptidase [Acidobacteriota bacterium]
MNRRRFLSSLPWAGAVFASGASASAFLKPVSSSGQTAGDRLQNLFENSPFVNASDTTTTAPLTGIISGPKFNQEYIDKLKQGRVTVVHASIVFWLYDDFYHATYRLYDFYKFLEGHQNDLRMVWNFSDIETAQREGKIAIVLHAHSPSVTDGDVRRLHILQKLGLRVMIFSHQQRSPLAEGAGEHRDGGLSQLGKYMLREMNKLHMIADFAHTSDQTLLDAVEISTDPIIVSHTCCRALTPHKSKALLHRNISDEGIKAVAQNGGVVGIMALTPHLLPEGYGKSAPLSLYVDHIEHVVQTAGVDHAGIGTEISYLGILQDFQSVINDTTARLGDNTPVMDTYRGFENQEKGTEPVARGMDDMALAKRNLIEELARRKYSDEDIRKILGANFLRVYERVLGR